MVRGARSAFVLSLFITTAASAKPTPAPALTPAGGERAGADEKPQTADSAAEARQQYQDGTKAFSAKRYSEAALHFEAAAAFKANAVALYTAALAWDLAGRPERAADAYTRALEVPGLDPKQTNVSKERVANLEKNLGTAVVTSVEPGWKVQLDTFTEVAAPARLHGQPGIHSLAIRPPNNKPVERRDVALEAGKVTPIELKEETKPSKPEPEPPDKPPTPTEPEAPIVHYGDPPFWTNVKVVGVGLAGVGVAVAGAGVVLGLNANDAKDAYDAAPSRPGYDHASSLEMWTNVALISGAVLVAGGIALIVVPFGGERRVRVAAGPRGLEVKGAF